ncbi:MAG TPA: pitrilysin family protein [Dissulfurispiraceae bacterium]|nr:pitrilysin family protein [Dissulfurispiraceae bacterium]
MKSAAALRNFLLVVVLCICPLAAADAVEEFRLDNGLKILFIEDHKIPLATFQIWYRVGSVDEPAGKSGMSHFLEHLMFKGTPRYGSKVFSNLIQRKGGTDNAFTTRDYTMYHQSLPSDSIQLSIELEADRMKNLLLDPKELESERSVVMEERRMRYEDDPQNLLDEAVLATSLEVQAYRKPVIGWMSEIIDLSRSDLADYYGTYYSPDNAFIIMSGDVRPDKLMPLIKKEFGKIPPAGGKLKRIKTVEPQQKGEKIVYVEKESAELPAIIMAYHVPSFPDKDSAALDVLSTVLSGGKSSRLYRSLVYEKRIALDVSADYSGLYCNPFLFQLSATVAPGKDVKEVEKALLEEIGKLSKEPPSELEVQKARNQVEASFIFARDSGYSEALYTGMFEVVGDWRLRDKYIEGIRSVTPEAVRDAAARYLTTQNRTTGYLIPGKPGGTNE